MRTSKCVLLAALLCGIPAVVARASNGSPGAAVGPCLPVIVEVLPVIMTGQGTTPQQETPVAVTIDIQANRPSSSTTPKTISLRKNYTVYVIVFGSAELEVADLDAGTIAFGVTGEEATPVRPPVIRDLNNDGFNDALFGFLTSNCGFEPGNTLGWLRGSKTDETPVAGSIAVMVSQ